MQAKHWAEQTKKCANVVTEVRWSKSLSFFLRLDIFHSHWFHVPFTAEIGNKMWRKKSFSRWSEIWDPWQHRQSSSSSGGAALRWAGWLAGWLLLLCPSFLVSNVIILTNMAASRHYTATNWLRTASFQSMNITSSSICLCKSRGLLILFSKNRELK